MIFLNRILLFVVVLGLLSTASCSYIRSSKDNPQPPANANSNAGNELNASKSPNDNIEDLRTNINVPFEPDEVSWRLLSNKQNGGGLIAVFRMAPSDAAAYASKVGPSGTKSAEVTVEEWFPAELKAMADTTGQSTISGTALPANEFVRDPFTEGIVYVIPESNYLVVELRKP
jgi:hypothetical protein